MIQTLLPIFPKETIRINDFLAFQKEDGHVYYFNAIMPIFTHHENDIASFRMITSQLYINGNCKQVDIVNAFGVSANSVKRYVKKYRQGGIKAFFKKLYNRKPRVLTLKVMKKAQKMLNDGKSRAEVSGELNLKSDTLYRAIRSGRLIEHSKIDKGLALTKSVRSIEDSQADMGMGCSRVMERLHQLVY